LTGLFYLGLILSDRYIFLGLLFGSQTMHRVALIVFVVLGFLIAYQVVNPYRSQVCHFWENGDLCCWLLCR